MTICSLIRIIHVNTLFNQVTYKSWSTCTSGFSGTPQDTVVCEGAELRLYTYFLHQITSYIILVLCEETLKRLEETMIVADRHTGSGTIEFFCKCPRSMRRSSYSGEHDHSNVVPQTTRQLFQQAFAVYLLNPRDLAVTTYICFCLHAIEKPVIVIRRKTILN